MISIHALTKSATTHTCDVCAHLDISIHALTKSATDTGALRKAWAVISIHALTKSATVSVPYLQGIDDISIHALTKSATDDLVTYINDWREFQSTHSQRVRPSISATSDSTLSLFQSTHSQRVRLNLHDMRLFMINISIHALTKSATHVPSIRFIH